MILTMPGLLSDERVAAAVRGERAALDAVATAVADQARCMVAARLSPTPGHFDAVDDLAQQSLLAMCEGIRRLEAATAEGLKAYLSGIVSRKVADFLRLAARSRVRRGGGGRVREMNWASSDAFTSVLEASGATPSSIAGRAEHADRMLAALGQLKPEHREAVTLAFFDQLPTGRIADLMGISRPAASMLVLRAVRALGREVAVADASAENHAPHHPA